MEMLLLSSVIAALVSGLFNVLLANRLKKDADIRIFRYTKLYELGSVEI